MPAPDTPAAAGSWADYLASAQPATPKDRPPASYRYSEALPSDSKVLAEILKTAEFNQLFESYYNLIHIPVAIIDLQANVLFSSRWQRVCVDFHRVHPETCKRCIESDTRIAQQLTEGRTYAIYRCLNGLTDCASPIILEGRHVANVFVGQFFTQKPDLEWFRRQAAQFGFDPVDYLEAVADVPVVAEERIAAILDLLVKMTHVVTSLSVDRQRAIDDQARQKVILDTIPQSVFWKDTEGRYLGCNAAFAKVAGLRSSEEIVGKTDFDLPWDRADADAYLADDQAVIRSRRAKLHFVENVRKSDGSTIVADTSKVPLIHSGGVLRGMVGVFSDITESQRAAEELEASEARFRTLIEKAPVAIGLSRGSRTLYVNGKYRELFRIPEHVDVVGQSILDLWTPEFRAMIEDYAQRRARGEAVPSTYEGTALRADGETFPVHVAVATVELPDGLASVGFFVDLTEIKRAHEAARKADEEYRSIVENALEGIVTFDRDWRITFTNARCDAIFGYERGELLGRPIIDIILEADREAHRQRRANWERGVQGVYEACYRRKDGTGVWLQVSGWTVFEEGAFVGFHTMVTDITARKQADELRGRLASIVESSEDAIISKTLEGTITSWNRGAEKLFGYTAAEALGQPMLMLFPPEGAGEEADIRARIARGETVAHYEAIRITKSGGAIVVSDTISPLRDATGKIVGASKIARDITARKRAEDALRRAEENYRLIYENALEGMYRTTPEGKSIGANPALARLLGYSSPAEVMAVVSDSANQTWKNPADRKAYMEKLEAEGIVRGFECQFRKRDGTEIWVSLNTQRVAGPDGRTLYYEGFIEDITERRRAEKELREAEELYRGIFEGAAEGIFRTSPSGRPLTANPTMARMLGYDSAAQLIAEIADTGALIWPNASDRAHVVEALETRGELRNYECQLRRRDGTLMWALMSARRVAGPDGRAVCLEGFISDITEKKRMEEQFLRVQRLESIGMLAAGIAHDLNNVLAPIGMAVPLLRNSRSEPAELRVLRTLESSAERGSNLVRQILGFAHGVSGAPQLVQIKHLLRDITEMIVETFPKSVVLDELIPRDLWPVVANPTQIHQVLLNLCVNARDAMPQGGRLRLTAENVSLNPEQAAAIGGARPGAWVVLHVEDSGTGISADVLPRIWEPFFTTKGAGKGTGLGLPTVRGIVETHGGFMTVESELGRGTVFRVYLPAAEAVVTTAPGAAAATATKGHGETILFADDERAIRDIVEPTFNYGGYKVVLAEDGAQATEIFRGQPDRFALVVTDLDMPVVDGATFARNVRSLRPAMKILALSGLEKRAGDVKWENFADDFLQKPFAADELLAAVERLLPAASDATNQP